MKKFYCVCGALSLAVHAPSFATVIIGFDDLIVGSAMKPFQSYTASGIIFDAGGGGYLFVPPNSSTLSYQNIDPDGASIVGYPIRASVFGDGLFDMIGFTFGYRTPVQVAPAGGVLTVRVAYADWSYEFASIPISSYAAGAVVFARTGVREFYWNLTTLTFDLATCGGLCNHTGFFNLGTTIDDVIVDNVTQRSDLPPFPHSNGIPEPSLWGLLISGFGLVGANLRWRRIMATFA